MDKSRRRLLFASAGASAVAAVVAACGGGGGYSPPPPSSMPPPPLPAGTCGATLITANHGHSLTIPMADTSSTVAITYSIQGIADHNHTITLTPGELAQIKMKTSASVTSSFASSALYTSHDHEVTVNCG